MKLGHMTTVFKWEESCKYKYRDISSNLISDIGADVFLKVFHDVYYVLLDKYIQYALLLSLTSKVMIIFNLYVALQYLYFLSDNSL